jgi:hypothetical protein
MFGNPCPGSNVYTTPGPLELPLAVEAEQVLPGDSSGLQVTRTENWPAGGDPPNPLTHGRRRHVAIPQ